MTIERYKNAIRLLGAALSSEADLEKSRRIASLISELERGRFDLCPNQVWVKLMEILS